MNASETLNQPAEFVLPIKNYHEFINREGTSYIDILSTGGKNGKKVNGATADNN